MNNYSMFRLDNDSDDLTFILIKENGLYKFKGEGSFCGWYIKESLYNVLIVASALVSCFYEDKVKKQYDITIETKDKVYSKVNIYSIYQKVSIVANNEDEAIAKFQDMVIKEIKDLL